MIRIELSRGEVNFLRGVCVYYRDHPCMLERKEDITNSQVEKGLGQLIEKIEMGERVEEILTGMSAGDGGKTVPNM